MNASKCFVYGRLEAFIVLWIKCWDVAQGDEGACIVGLGGLRVVWRCSKWSRTVFECGSDGGLYRRGGIVLFLLMGGHLGGHLGGHFWECKNQKRQMGGHLGGHLEGVFFRFRFAYGIGKGVFVANLCVLMGRNTNMILLFYTIKYLFVGVKICLYM